MDKINDKTQIIKKADIKKADQIIKDDKVKTKKKSIAGIALIVGVVILAIPTLIFVWIIVSAAFVSGPIEGNRFEDDLDPAITEEQISSISESLSKINVVENVEVNLTSATLRVYLDVSDSIVTDPINEEPATDDKGEKEEVKTPNRDSLYEVANDAYDIVADNLPISTYFNRTKERKMYDLEIHVYNSLDFVDDDKFLYVILNKSSNMDDTIINVVSEPLYPDLAEQLRDDEEKRNNPNVTPNEDVQVSDPDIAPDIEEDPDAQE